MDTATETGVKYAKDVKKGDVINLAGLEYEVVKLDTNKKGDPILHLSAIDTSTTITALLVISKRASMEIIPR